jgi:shikimate dehydrogenase
LSVFDTDQHRSDTLAADLSGRFGTDRAHAGRLNHGGSALSDALHHADGLAHATPTGMRGHPGLPLPAELLRSDLWVADVVYRPLDTELLTAARARGCRVLDGGLMVVYQAADALRIFTGREPDIDRMLRHFKALVHTGRQGAHAHR